MFRIAQISDTHLSDEKPFFVDNFARVGEALRQDRPDLVLNSGDITLDGASNEADMAAARLLHDGLDLPMRFLPGNHDLGDSQDAPDHGEGPIDALRRRRYVSYFGPDWWWFDVPGWRVLGLNAQLLGSDLPEAEEQEETIVDVAASVGSRRLALFLHKPLFDRTVDESEITGRFVNPVPRRLLMASLVGVTPALISCGHVHQYRASETFATRHVWATSTAFVIPDHRQPRYGLKEVGYVEHRLYPDGRHESALVRVPGLPTLDIAHFPQVYGPV
ncbi:3',5'-cyclic AMP phosphodiesterase CpdA [Enhydrobacter aerosaccus]|uniref:3',5'-cyclic AMP phosphodiesterase CpdA n=1 Tax=Enhydrobacter aerosaccus TaxID=225324 RepID=A0A1T4TBU1_9HYPH|nr:metallophosphoesterase [Enhydrobacter aerosaccus]SKA37962.1 3',5'-cyclic AMP phosphodiesterase CpdA [Enhydrobacter aerosaccus]